VVSLDGRIANFSTKTEPLPLLRHLSSGAPFAYKTTNISVLDLFAGYGGL
jgi:hypothetical protein